MLTAFPPRLVAAVPDDAQWNALSDRRSALENLKDDWNSYGAPAPNEAALSSARAILESARDRALLPDEIVPSVESGVLIYFTATERHADIESFNDGTLLAMTSHPPADPYIWPVRNESKDIQEALEEIRAFMGR